MLPGMAHCRGGDGVDTADFLTVMERWVEHGEAPDSLDAYRSSAAPTNYAAYPLQPATIVAGRRLFPYPAASVYAGSGDTRDPDNWVRK